MKGSQTEQYGSENAWTRAACQAIRLVMNLGGSWGQAGREKLSKHGFGTGRDRSMPTGRVGTRVGCIGQGHASVSCMRSGA